MPKTYTLTKGAKWYHYEQAYGKNTFDTDISEKERR